MKEDQPCHPVSEYGKNKVLVWEQAKELSVQLRIDYIHTRIFSVYGPGDHPWSLISACLDTFLKGGHMELGACTSSGISFMSLSSGSSDKTSSWQSPGRRV